MSRNAHSSDRHSSDGHSSQGGRQPQRGGAPYGTWVVVAAVALSILLMWFLVLGILGARS